MHDSKLAPGSVWLHKGSVLPSEDALVRDALPSNADALLGEVQRVSEDHVTLRCFGQLNLLDAGETWSTQEPESPSIPIKWARVPVAEFIRRWRFLFQGDRPN
ncbi:MAG TPA: hypothetical protein VMK12_05425 [Anaeromyxobacteraceae bacterium]|nr:hypothetical protein [Anaeromyxobacteraceae bacterium]